MYLIQLFDDNCGTCCSRVTNVFVDDIEDFSKHYLSVETKNTERVDRFLRSKAGEIVTDYYSDSPDLNIVRKMKTEDLATVRSFAKDKTITLINGYGCDSVYHFDRLIFTIRYIKCEDKYYKLIKTTASGCCHMNSFDSEKPWYRAVVHGNKFWFYKEDSETLYNSEKRSDFKGTTIESFVWHTADVFENEEDMKADMETTWPSDLQINRVLKDLPGDAG